MQRISLKAQEQPSATNASMASQQGDGCDWHSEQLEGVQDVVEVGCSSRRTKVKKHEGADPFKIKECKKRGVQLFPQILTSNQHPRLGPFCCLSSCGYAFSSFSSLLQTIYKRISANFLLFYVCLGANFHIFFQPNVQV